MSLPPAPPAPPSTSPPAFDCEVLVVGGGPAGSTIAALLAERGRDVILAEKGRHPRFHIGESLLPANAALFERLGVRAEVERFGMTKYGAEFVSPDHEHRPMIDFAEAWDKSMPYAWQVRRSELDELLFRNAAAKGARAREGCRIRKVEFDAEGGDGRGRARRRREADLAQPLPRRRDRPRHVAGEPVPQQGEEPQAQQLGDLRPLSRRQAFEGRLEGNITIFWFDHGWFWYIPLNDGVTSIGAVCWPYYMKSRTKPLREFFRDTIALCPALAERLAEAELVVRGPCHRQLLLQQPHLEGEHYLLLGDAYAFIDPVFSSGVYAGDAQCLRGRRGHRGHARPAGPGGRARRRFDRMMRHGPRSSRGSSSASPARPCATSSWRRRTRFGSRRR